MEYSETYSVLCRPHHSAVIRYKRDHRSTNIK